MTCIGLNQSILKLNMSPPSSSSIPHSSPNSPSIIEDLMLGLKAKSSLSKDCQVCLGFGIIYNINNYSRTKSGFEICKCIPKFCEIIKDEKSPLRNIQACQEPFERFLNLERGFIPCECKDLRFKLNKLIQLERHSQIPIKYAGCFLNDVESEPYKIHQKNDTIDPINEAYFTIYDYSIEHKNPVGLYLWGETGCGKTLISCAILNEMIRFHLVPVLYAKFSRDILAKIRSTFTPGSINYGEGINIEKNLGSIPILVIDDFEIYKETDWVHSILYDLIDSRYEKNLLTIITSNKPMSYWKDMGNGRIYSRLNEMCKSIEVSAPDYRILKSQNPNL